MTSLTFAKAMLHRTAEFVIPKTPLKLPHGYRRILEFVQLGEPIEDGSTDLQFGDFAVRLTPDDAFTKQFEVSHFGRDKAASMIDSPFLPDFPVQIFLSSRRVAARMTFRTMAEHWSSMAWLSCKRVQIGKTEIIVR